MRGNPASLKRVLLFLAKAGISALLLYLSLRQVNFSGIGQRLDSIDPRWLVFMLFMLCVQIVFLAFRWREIVTVCGTKLPVAAAVRYSFIGQFFSQVLPSTVGGDAARVWLLARGETGWAEAVYSVLIDRVVGISILALIVVACLPFTLALVHDPVARAALVFIDFAALGAPLVFLLLGIQHLPVMERWWLTRHLAATSRMAWRLCRSPGAGLRVSVLSFVAQTLTVMVIWSAAKAIHAPVGFGQTFLLVLPVILIATVPISIAGWGVRENAMVLAFLYAGLSGSDGLIISVLFGTATLAVGSIGGIVWIGSGYRWRSVRTIETDTLVHDPSA